MTEWLETLTYTKGQTPTGATHMRRITVFTTCLTVERVDHGATSEGNTTPMPPEAREKLLEEWHADLIRQGYALERR